MKTEHPPTSPPPHSPAHVTRLSAVLSANPQLRSVTLNWCGLNDELLAELCEGLHGNMALQTLVLTGMHHDTLSTLMSFTTTSSGNRISDVGASHICTIMDNTALQMCNLSANRIGNEGFTLLVSAAERSTSLSDLRLGGNRIKLVTEAAVEEVLGPEAGRVAHLSFLDLRDNEIEGGLIAKVRCKLQGDTTAQLATHDSVSIALGPAPITAHQANPTPPASPPPVPSLNLSVNMHGSSHVTYGSSAASAALDALAEIDVEIDPTNTQLYLDPTQPGHDFSDTKVTDSHATHGSVQCSPSNGQSCTSREHGATSAVSAEEEAWDETRRIGVETGDNSQEVTAERTFNTDPKLAVSGNCADAYDDYAPRSSFLPETCEKEDDNREARLLLRLPSTNVNTSFATTAGDVNDMNDVNLRFADPANLEADIEAFVGRRQESHDDLGDFPMTDTLDEIASQDDPPEVPDTPDAPESSPESEAHSAARKQSVLSTAQSAAESPSAHPLVPPIEITSHTSDIPASLPDINEDLNEQVDTEG